MTPLPSLHSWLDHSIDEFEAVVLDIDGVLLNDGRRLPGSQRLFNLLQHRHMPYLLLTNDGNHSVEEKVARLNHAGLPVTSEQIVSCGHAIAPLVQAQGLGNRLFFAMGDIGTPCYAQTAGLVVTRELDELKRCAGIIIGEEHYHWESVINAVVNFLIDHPQAPLVVPNPDEFYPMAELKIQIAAGGVARFMQQVLKAYGQTITPIYLGKPYAPIFRLAQARLAHQTGRTIAPQKILMVGDNLAADICGGLNMGYRTALMLTGVTSPSALAKSDIKPELVFDQL